MSQDTPSGAVSAPLQCVVTSPQRDPPHFYGLRGEDVEEWLDSYTRVSQFNRWDDYHKLLNVGFYLTQVAETWYLNHRHYFTDWAGFTTELRKIFGSTKARSDNAKRILDVRVQQANEIYTWYIEDVLALCRRVDKDIQESDRVRHILKGINEIAFNALVLQNLDTVSDVISTCQRLDERQ